jgi:hypothetical protein
VPLPALIVTQFVTQGIVSLLRESRRCLIRPVTGPAAADIRSTAASASESTLARPTTSSRPPGAPMPVAEMIQRITRYVASRDVEVWPNSDNVLRRSWR